MSKPLEKSPEETGEYRCPHCKNEHAFTGIDERGYGGPDACKCGGAAHGSICECYTTLTQDFDVTKPGLDAEVQYHLFTGGGRGAIPDLYTKIICRKCNGIVWQEHMEPTNAAA